MRQCHPSRTSARLLLVAWALTGCGPNWQPISLPQPKPLDPGKVIEFHVKEDLVRLHGVQFSRDSLSGIPWLEHLSCDSCRVGYALADVTQLRTGNPGAGAWNIAIPIIAIMAFLYGMAAAFSGMGGS